MNLATEITAARIARVPLIAISTADPGDTAYRIGETLPSVPQMFWSSTGGITCSQEHSALLAAALQSANVEAEVPIATDPGEMLHVAQHLPEACMLLCLALDEYFNSERVVTGVWALRDTYKTTKRQLVILSTDWRPPTRLRWDVIHIDDPLPDRSQAREIVQEMVEASDIHIPDELTTEDPIEAAVSAVSGLAAFTIEQAVAMSVDPETRTLDHERLWSQKRDIISSVDGLGFYRGEETLHDVGGLEALRRLLDSIFHGRYAPDVILWLDELEKTMAGAQGDSSGVSQDMHGAWLRAMEDNRWKGLMFIGHPGTGKSYVAKATGNTYGKPTLSVDLNAAKSKYVGDSERNVRSIVKTIRAMADHVLVIATSNKLESIAPELKRRFTLAPWFFDLPNEQERAEQWQIHINKLGIFADPFGNSDAKPSDTNWVGSDIRNCCELAHELNIPLTEAAQYVLPIAEQDPQAISRLQQAAHNHYFDCRTGQRYQAPQAAKAVSTEGRRRPLFN